MDQWFHVCEQKDEEKKKKKKEKRKTENGTT